MALTDPEIREVHNENYGAYRKRLNQLVSDILPPHTPDKTLAELTASVSAFSDGL